jgi:tRNA nucleotidyltransferase (CCA-adding enzyme)
MKYYTVGGAVRDMFLGVPSSDIDYVVTNSTPKAMIALGYKQVGADFPVFLNTAGDEFALARREKKTGDGYHGFAVEFDQSVSITEDLGRRDLTINAMAQDFFNVVYDPFNGQGDIKDKILRAVNPDAFKDDPVRVLRLARFAARFGPDWTISDETLSAARDCAISGEMANLTAERVWKELSRAIMEPHPELFFEVLQNAWALADVFPIIEDMFWTPERVDYHPEANTFAHTMLVLKQAAKSDSLDLRMAALTHDFGKTITPRDKLPSHPGHEKDGVVLVEKFCDDYRLPTQLKKKLALTCRWHMHMHKWDELKATTKAKVLKNFTSDTFSFLIELGKCDARGRLHQEEADLSRFDTIQADADKYFAVNFADVFAGVDVSEMNGDLIGQRMHQAKVRAMK